MGWKTHAKVQRSVEETDHQLKDKEAIEKLKDQKGIEKGCWFQKAV